MDFTIYDKELEQLHIKHQEYLKVADKRVIAVLNKMLRRAMSMNDCELIGYTYHSLAFAEHFVMGRYRLFLENLALATRYLLQCENQAEMMHVYYLIAIDATNKGLNDIAVHYFQEARSIAEITKQTTSVAILDQSIGHIYMQLGRYKQALSFIKKAMSGIKKDPTHPHYLSNLTANYMNHVIASLGLNQLDQALVSFNKVRDIIQQNRDVLKSGTLLNYELLHLQLALRNQNEAEASDSYDALIERIRDDSMIHLYMDEIKSLSLLLIQQAKYAWLEEILQIIKHNGISSDAIEALRILAGIKIDYYKALGREVDLKIIYQEQDEIRELTLRRQQSLRNYIANLVQLTTNLRKEREALLARQSMLINMAEIDPLTKLYNRFAANQKLDEAFELALINKTKLGIVYLDVDGLKRINDLQGHLAGDQLLISLADALNKEAAICSAFVSRFGGDEFVIIFENKSDKDIRDYLTRVNKSSNVVFSSGFYNAIPLGRQKSWYFLEKADKELYKEKNQKKAAQIS